MFAGLPQDQGRDLAFTAPSLTLLRVQTHMDDCLGDQAAQVEGFHFPGEKSTPLHVATRRQVEGDTRYGSLKDSYLHR